MNYFFSIVYCFLLLFIFDFGTDYFIWSFDNFSLITFKSVWTGHFIFLSLNDRKSSNIQKVECLEKPAGENVVSVLKHFVKSSDFCHINHIQEVN